MVNKPAVLLCLLLAGCASTAPGRRWEIAAAIATAGDIASTQMALNRGGTEANPLYGRHPSLGKVVTVSVVSFRLAQLGLQERNQDQRRRFWRAVTFVRIAVTAWNLAQR